MVGVRSDSNALNFAPGIIPLVGTVPLSVKAVLATVRAQTQSPNALDQIF
jgi:hypothetical protein